MNSATTTPTAGPLAGPSTKAAAPSPVAKPAMGAGPAIGEIVLVKLAPNVLRPMIVSGRELWRKDDHTDPELRLSGTICCEPEDHTCPAFRQSPSGADPARFHGRPERIHPTAYAEGLGRGLEIGQWITRPSNLPGKG